MTEGLWHNIIVIAGLMWAAFGLAAILLVRRDRSGAEVLAERPIIYSITFIFAGPIALGGVLGILAAFKSFDERLK